MAEIFLDTSYVIALAAPGDEYHERAAQLAKWLTTEATPLVTTRAVALEIGNALARARYRQAAINLLDALENDPQVEIVPLTEELYERAAQLYRARPDKE